MERPDNPAYRDPLLRQAVQVRRTKKQEPPWHDEWSISMDAATLVELSAELLALPDPLPERLLQLRRLTEDVIAHGLGIDEGHSAAWEG